MKPRRGVLTILLLMCAALLPVPVAASEARSTPTHTLTMVDARADAQRYTRAEKRRRAGHIHRLALHRFNRLKGREHSGVAARLDWGDNGCSAPDIAAYWRDYFDRSCERHDFGYRNFGNGWREGLALRSTDAMKRRIDERFYADMRHQCGGAQNCLDVAWAFYLAVRKSGKAQTAFYMGECHPGKFCLFDDHDYEDRRIALTASENDMNDIDFGDKTSSVKNRDSVAWAIHDDHDYDDRWLCVEPGAKARDLDDYDFGDKTSSAKRLTYTDCR